MTALETALALQWLRPLVETKTWDYCVVWKFGDDPSRFIEWVGCCCGGANGDIVDAKEERGEEHKHQFIPLCKDTLIKHTRRTKACQSLAHFPSSMPLYSGIHGEAVMSTEPIWHRYTKDSNSNQSHESTGTQVLIPVVSGLIELFSTKHIPKDQKIVEFITSNYKLYNINMEQKPKTAQSYSTVSLNKQSHDPVLGEYLNNCPAPLHYLNCTPKLPFLIPIPQPSTYPSLEGSSIGSNPSNEHPSLRTNSSHVSPNVLVNESFEKYPASKKPYCNSNLPSNQESNISGCANHLVGKDSLKSTQGIERKQYHSKNLVTERNRRNRIKDALYTLRSLVPNISKMDRAAILGDAIKYIEELQEKEKKLLDELREIEKEEFNGEIDDLKMPELIVHKGTRNSTAMEHNQDLPGAVENKQMEVQVEVKQNGMRDFLLRFLCKQKQGGITRLIEAVYCLGLEVIDANVTTFNGKVLINLQVEVNKTGVQPKSLKDALIKLTRQVYK